MTLNKPLFSKGRYALLSVLFLSGLQQARALPTCSTASLAQYIALDQAGGCDYDDLTFFRFSFAPAVSTGGAPLATANDITVTPISTAVGIGFSYSSPYFMLTNPATIESASYGIGYSVDPPPIILEQGLSLDPPYGNVNVLQNLCLNDVLANACAFGVTEQQRVTPPSPISFVVFPNPVPFVDVETQVTLQASPGNPAGFDAIETGSLLTLTTTTPEPGSAALTVLALMIGAGSLRSRKNRRRS